MAQVRHPRSVLSPHSGRSIQRHKTGTWRRTGTTVQAGIAAFVIFGLFAVDALLRPPGTLDLAMLKLVQRLDHPELGPRLEIFETLTDSSGAVLAWATTLVLFAVFRWWVPLLGCLAIPLGGVVNETVSRVLIQRTRPHLEELRHVSDNFEERSFPSGHVVGAVLLYGYIWYVVGKKVRYRVVAGGIRAAAATVILLTGFDRVWSGAHWPSDVAGGYALGFGLLALLILASSRVEGMDAHRTTASPPGSLLS